MSRWIFSIAVVGVLLTSGLVAFGLGYFSLSDPVPAVTVVSPEAASSAEVKLAQLDVTREARITSVELTSLFRYRPEIWALGILKSPTVTMSADSLRLSGRFATAEIPTEPTLDSLRDVLPDTTDVAIAGTVRSLQSSTTILEVFAIEVAGMPIPRRFFDQVLERLGQGETANLPTGSFVLPLPSGVGTARIEQGELVLLP